VENNIYGTAYKQVNLLQDVGMLASNNVQGLEMGVRRLRSTKVSVASIKGFRYEIEGAAELVRNKKTVVALSKRVNVPWRKGFLGSITGRTDIDVVVEENGQRIYYQFKRTTGAVGSGAEGLQDAKAWVTKGLKDLNAKGQYDRVRYALPNGAADLPNSVETWFNKVGIVTEAIPSLD